MTAAEPQTASDREIISTRIFDAPRELVFRAWTDPAHLVHWWGPKGFTNTFHEFDLRPGGHWRFTMHGPDGTDYANHNAFVELLRPERIVLDHLSMPRFRVHATFEDLGTKTRLTFHMRFESAADCERVRPYAVPGNEQNFDRLGVQLGKLAGEWRELVITRTFAAPRPLLWRMWTDPAHFAQWWGPKGFTNPVCEIDLRVGGALRVVMRAPDGAEYPMDSVFREIAPPERLVFSSRAVDAAGTVLLDGFTTVTFAERAGGTELTVRTRAIALLPQALPMLQGMEAGWAQTIERLTERVATSA